MTEATMNICYNCKKEFISKKKSKKFCSLECFNIYRNNPEIKARISDKRKMTNIKKYGVDNPAKNLSIKEKTKKTCLKKYGAVSPTLNKNIYRKQIDTNIKKYGTSNPFQNKLVQDKQRKTMIDIYGVKTPLQNAIILEKTKNTNIKKYGVDNPAKNLAIKEKTRKTCLEKYGEICPSKNSDIRSKIINNSLKVTYNKLVSEEKFKNIIPLFNEMDYKGNISYKTHYNFVCKECNQTFEDTLINGNIPLCPTCFPKKTFYRQNQLYEWILSILNEPVIKNDRKILKGKELDILIPSKNIAIEFNGLYWHSELQKDKKYHLFKTEECLKNGIKLIHIFEDEWVNKQDIVKEKLMHLFMLNKEKSIFARNCEIKKIDYKTTNEFLNKYHIQGSYKSPIRLGAFYKNELLSIMTFGKLRLHMGNKKQNNNDFEIHRFCSLPNKNIIGIGGKLISFFIKNYNPSKIVTYADRRWSPKSAFYEKIGFKFIKNTSPNYWYINKNFTKRYYRFTFRKQNLHKVLDNFLPNLSEWENMKLNGYNRIWDCGNIKYEFYNQSFLKNISPNLL
jgi:hypothetical protein